MNPIALELNQQLEGTIALRLFSEFGKRIFFPRGIVAQANEAAARAKKYDATIGMAVERREPMVLSCIREQVPGLSNRELTAYTPTGGIQTLRESWKSQILLKNPSLKPENFSLPMLVPGLTSGIYHSAELFLDQNDIVIVPNMSWDNYELIIQERRQAEIRNFVFFNDKGKLNLAGINACIEQAFIQEKRKKIALFLNFPNNPTGYSPTQSEASALRELLVAWADLGLDILAICDDAYFGLFYEDDTFTESIFSILATAHERILAIKVDGSTKEDFVWGFRIGFISFGAKGLDSEHYAALMSKLTGSIRACTSSSSSIGQYLLQRAYASLGYHSQKNQAYEKLERRYRRVREIISNWDAKTSSTKRSLDPLPFNSGYFMSFKCRDLSAENLRIALLEKGIGTIALQDRFLRVAYAAVDEQDLDNLFAEIFLTAQALKR